MRVILVILYCLVVISCRKKEKINPDYYAVSDAPLYAVKEKSKGSDTLIACGGKRYERGDVFYSLNGGMTWWAMKNIAEKALYDIIALNDTTLCAVGFDGKLMISYSFGNTWTLKQLDYIPLKRIKAINNKLYICGGDGFRTGIIYQCNTNGDIIKRDTFENELSDIVLASDHTLKCCGYGIVLSSSDNGQTWSADDAAGDFFKCFVETHDALYAVGMSGVIVKYINGKWLAVGKGNQLNLNNLLITGSAYNAQSESWISAGKKNVLIALKENGKTPTQLKTPKEFKLNYNAISTLGNDFILCTDEGAMIILPAY
jgi:hypothetical protein